MKKVYISLARVICALAVIMIHTNADCFSDFSKQDCWGSGNFIEALLIFAVPIFIMITGATLIDYSDKYSTKEYFKKRLMKTFVPYVFWGIIVGTLHDKVLNTANVFWIYYFFLYLFGAYLCIPLFSFVKKEYKEKLFTYLIVVSFVLNYLIPFICTLCNVTYAYKVPFDVANAFLIYILIGYLIDKKEISLRWRLVSYMFSLIGFLLHIGGSYIESMKAGEIMYTFRGYTNLPGLLAAVGVFVFLKQIGQSIKSEKIIRGIEILSGYTFPIYLIHLYVMEFVSHYFIEDVHSLVYRIVCPFFIFVICVGITWGIRKIPFGKYILP